MYQQVKNEESLRKETWIISRTEEGFRIYSPVEPTRSYIVTDGPAGPRCSCSDFQNHHGGLHWRCKHIQAILNQLEKSNPRVEDPYDREERLAIQSENGSPENGQPPKRQNGSSEMLIKRSVSPDGRIDSLSIEFSCPVDGASASEIKARAEKTLQLQAEIVKRFLGRNSKENGELDQEETVNDGAIPAEMVDIGGMNGKWGRRLFINLRANGKIMRLFGSNKQLAEFLAQAGFPGYQERISEGIRLNLPCRVITKPSEDGRFLNVKQVLPRREKR